jgi:hypothetical protein
LHIPSYLNYGSLQGFLTAIKLSFFIVFFNKFVPIPWLVCSFLMDLMCSYACFDIVIVTALQIIPWGDLDSLAMLQRQLDVDILITGHTHQFKAYKHEGGVIINPGSATGAFSSITYDVNPSFVLMDIDGLRVVVYVYELIEGVVKVDKIDFKKAQPVS